MAPHARSACPTHERTAHARQNEEHTSDAVTKLPGRRSKQGGRREAFREWLDLVQMLSATLVAAQLFTPPSRAISPKPSGRRVPRPPPDTPGVSELDDKPS